MAPPATPRGSGYGNLDLLRTEKDLGDEGMEGHGGVKLDHAVSMTLASGELLVETAVTNMGGTKSLASIRGFR